MIDLPLTFGIVGMVCILFAFLMVQLHYWTQDQMRYDIVNFFGSALLLIYAFEGRVWPFVILNSVWALYSLWDVMGDMRKRGNVENAEVNLCRSSSLESYDDRHA